MQPGNGSFSGAVLQLSEDRGKESSGCRLDRSILTEAAGLLLAALEERPDILVLNKFGKVEAEGEGLRDALAKAVELGVPIVVGVPFRNLDQWRTFAGDMVDECEAETPRIRNWLGAHGLLPESRSEKTAIGRPASPGMLDRS